GLRRYDETNELFITNDFRLIETQRLFGKIISCRFIRACPATSANLDKLAASAFAAVLAVITQIAKHFRIFPYICKSLFLHIAAIQFQITAGLHLADMGNKAKCYPAQTSSCRFMEVTLHFFLLLL